MNARESLWNRRRFLVFDETDLKSAIQWGIPYKAVHYAIILVHKGSIVAKANLLTQTITANQITIAKPGYIYEIEKHSDDLSLTGVLCTPDFLAETGVLISGTDLLRLPVNGAISLTKTDVACIEQLLAMLLKKFPTSAGSFVQQKIVTHLFLALAHELTAVLKNYIGVAEVKLNRGEEILKSFLELLDKYVKTERSVRFYASKLNITQRHLSHTTRQLTSQTASELIDKAAILEAKLLLADPAVNVARVSQLLNFSDQSFFGKYFKKHTGISPTAYRAMMKG